MLETLLKDYNGKSSSVTRIEKNDQRLKQIQLWKAQNQLPTTVFSIDLPDLLDGIHLDIHTYPDITHRDPILHSDDTYVTNSILTAICAEYGMINQSRYLLHKTRIVNQDVIVGSRKIRDRNEEYFNKMHSDLYPSFVTTTDWVRCNFMFMSRLHLDSIVNFLYPMITDAFALSANSRYISFTYMFSTFIGLYPDDFDLLYKKVQTPYIFNRCWP
jgi:hypothetical protein